MILHRTQARAATCAAKRAAFTLMEVLVVAAILVILASVASVGVLRYLDDAKESTALMGIANIEKAAGIYKLNHNDWPSALTELIVPEDGKAAPLEEKELHDPWGQPYVYEPSNRHPATGKPKISCTCGGSKIISNWN